MSSGPKMSCDPCVVWLGDAAHSAAERASLELACRFYGFSLDDTLGLSELSSSPAPLLVVITGQKLAACTPAQRTALAATATSLGAVIAVVGIGLECTADILAQFTDGATVKVEGAGCAVDFLTAATRSSDVGYELRGLRFPLGAATTINFEDSAATDIRVLAHTVCDQQSPRPAVVRLGPKNARCYLLAHVAAPADAAPAPGSYPPARFGAIAPYFLLLRDVGGHCCWLPSGPLANLTIDDPWLREPYGCLSFAGLLTEMKRERFHTTIGFVPWNYDRSSTEVVSLIRDNPSHFSIAVHGNNHDRYEFFRYEAHPGDNQRAKPLAEQAFNIRQAMTRMELFQQCTGLTFDRIMVFPHGVSPAATFAELKRHGFWATFNYSNVPLGENPSADRTVALRSVNSDWYGFPAVRRAYPEKYPEAAIAIDLFLGNPVLFMSHQDLFFDGIGSFSSYARTVNVRQPAVQWKSLGEISCHLHRVRWLGERHCEVRLSSRHAKVENPQAGAAEFRFFKFEPVPGAVERITLDGIEIPWTLVAHGVNFSATVPAGATSLAEIHYRRAPDEPAITVRRSGFRNRSLRLIADFRDLTLSRSLVGRLLTRKYYGPGKKRLTFGGLVSRLKAWVRGSRTVMVAKRS